ncbi:MAG: response regulator [Epsilonproteobacteria bacterium]|nr:response regulator [Campylobacterota bacterium]
MEIKDLKAVTKELNLLYLEDNAQVSRVNMQLFKDIFKHVDLAEDGATGLEMYQKHRYDLVISDINLPKMNGIEVLKKILAIQEVQPIIVISAYNKTEYRHILKSMRIKYFLTKPVESKILLSTIYASIRNIEEVVYH